MLIPPAPPGELMLFYMVVTEWLKIFTLGKIGLHKVSSGSNCCSRSGSFCQVGFSSGRSSLLQHSVLPAFLQLLNPGSPSGSGKKTAPSHAWGPVLAH